MFAIFFSRKIGMAANVTELPSSPSTATTPSLSISLRTEVTADCGLF
jgi:hypothetical protein